MLSEVADVTAAPELLAVREQVRSWRFYDSVRTDASAPARVPQAGTFSPVLDDDGGNLPAALQTVRELDPVDSVGRAVDDAFPGSSVEVVDRTGSSACSCTSRGCCARSAPRSCRTARCATCSSWRRC
jgi:predicted ATPase